MLFKLCSEYVHVVQVAPFSVRSKSDSEPKCMLNTIAWTTLCIATLKNNRLHLTHDGQASYWPIVM